MTKLSRDDCALLAGGWQGWVSVLGITPGVLAGTAPASASALGCGGWSCGVGTAPAMPQPSRLTLELGAVQSGCCQGSPHHRAACGGAWSRSAWGRTLVVRGCHLGRRSCKGQGVFAHPRSPRVRAQCHVPAWSRLSQCHGPISAGGAGSKQQPWVGTCSGHVCAWPGSAVALVSSGLLQLIAAKPLGHAQQKQIFAL